MYCKILAIKSLSVALIFSASTDASAQKGSGVIDDPLKWPTQCAPEVQPTADSAALERMPKLTENKMSTEQRDAAAKISSGPRGCIFGPFSVLQRSPELLTRSQLLGEYLRFESILPKRLRELAILETGYVERSPYVWYIHLPEALKAGLSRETCDAIAKGERPADLDQDEVAILDVLDDLHRHNSVSDAVYDRAHARFGDQGLVELVGLDGYLTLVARELNMARVAVPASVHIPFAAPWEKVG
jgi:4-carboxymuconolactone decarboxylase